MLPWAELPGCLRKLLLAPGLLHNGRCCVVCVVSRGIPSFVCFGVHVRSSGFGHGVDKEPAFAACTSLHKLTMAGNDG